MNSEKVKAFITLAGQRWAAAPRAGTEEERKLGAQLLLSEVLEYVIKGLGVTPVVNGMEIHQPDELHYKVTHTQHDIIEMLDGLSDVAYTMYWNQLVFGLPLEEAFELVCDNNLTKFVKLNGAGWRVGELERSLWHCKQDIVWPAEVAAVTVLKLGEEFFAVGKDARGKVRKPSSYVAVDLSGVGAAQL